jgi:hypothetical protein
LDLAYEFWLERKTYCSIKVDFGFITSKIALELMYFDAISSSSTFPKEHVPTVFDYHSKRLEGGRDRGEHKGCDQNGGFRNRRGGGKKG